MKNYRHEFINPNDALNIHLKFSIDTGSIINKHFHDWIEIVYIIKGSLEFQVNNKTQLLRENDFIVVNPMSIHSTKCIHGNVAILLQIPISFLEEFNKEINNYRFNVDLKSNNARVQTKLNNIRDIMKDLWIAYQFHVDGYIFRCYSLVFELIYILVHSFSYKINNIDKIETEKNLKRIRKIIKYVKKYYSEDISLTMVSSIVNLNPIYFSRFFKTHMGVTFLEYLNLVRLEHIYTDLLNTDLNIKDIQEKHGFYNSKLFRRMFKDTYGGTPNEIRYNKSK